MANSCLNMSVKKRSENSLPNENLYTSKNLNSDEIKTTDINILLNRVKLDKKNTFKKKLSLLILLVTGLSLLVMFVVV